MVLILVADLDDGTEVKQDVPVPNDISENHQKVKAWAAHMAAECARGPGILEFDSHDRVTLIPAHRIRKIRISIPRVALAK